MIAQELATIPGLSPGIVGMARRMRRLFRIAAPDAPGLVLIGGEIALDADESAVLGAPALSVTGNGLTLPKALVSCLAEGAEWLSQIERPGDLMSQEAALPMPGGWMADAMGQTPQAVDRIIATRHADQQQVAVPADLALRRKPQDRRLPPVGPLSAGCAAGIDPADALDRAVLELIERDAAALWWLGGRRARPVAEAVIRGLPLGILRGETRGRTTHLLDLTTELQVPVCAAWSCNDAGDGLAVGIAARKTLPDAAEAALLELAQMELAAPLAQRKAIERGSAALNPTDRRHLARAACPVATIPALEPHGAPAPQPPVCTLSPAAHLGAHGHAVFSLDLTRPEMGVPVLRAIVPTLQPYAPEVTTARLAAALQQAGADFSHMPEIALY